MATERKMLHRDTGQSETGYVGYSWTTLFWGPFPALFRGDFLTFLAFIVTGVILSVLTAGIGGFVGLIVWSFLYNDYYTSQLKGKGYEFQEPYSERDQPEDSGVGGTHKPEDTKGSSFEITRIPAAGPDDPYANRELNSSYQVAPPTSEEQVKKPISRSEPKRTPKQEADLQRHLRHPKGMASDEGTPVADMSKSVAKSAAKGGCAAISVIGLGAVLSAIGFVIALTYALFFGGWS